tara:strand:- start:802 stop:1041 length:240 start_codon:yes stop_codon:yes gene_type:complete
MEKLNLGEFLHRNSHKSNKELADSIREVKRLSNRHDNVVVHQEKKSLISTAKKLSQCIKSFNNEAELIITINKKQWQQD